MAETEAPATPDLETDPTKEWHKTACVLCSANCGLEVRILVAFDNRRILHGREPFDTTAGVRRLRGTYLDSDEVYSRMRVLRRHLTSSKPSQTFSATGENSNA